MKVVIPLLIAVLAIGTAHGQPLNLSDFETIALKRSTLIKQLDKELQAARFELKSSSNGYWPSFSLGARYYPRHFTGSQTANFKASVDFKLLQFLLRRPHQMNAKRATIVLAKASRRIALHRELWRIRQTYLRYLGEQTQHDAYQRIAAILRAKRKTLLVLHKSGRVLPQAVLKVENRLLQVLHHGLKVRLASQDMQKRIERQTGRLFASGLRLVRPTVLRVVPSSQTLIKLAHRQRWELKKLTAQRQVLISLAKARRHKFAKLTLGAGYSAGVGKQAGEPRGFTFSLTFKAPFTVFSQASNGGKQLLARAQAKRFEMQRRATLIGQQVRKAHHNLTSAVTQWQVHRQTVVLAKERLRVLGLRAKSTIGSLKPVDVLALYDSQVDVANAKRQLQHSKTTTLLAQFALLNAVGLTDFRRDATSPKVVKTTRKKRDIWYWKASRLSNNLMLQALAGLAKTKSIRRVYLSFNKQLNAQIQSPDGAARVAAMLKTLRDSGLQVDALIGNANWALASKRSEMTTRIKAIVRFVTRYKGAFVGVHLDIEPHTLPQFKGKMTFIEPLTQSFQAARNALGSSKLLLAADLPVKAFRAEGKRLKSLLAPLDIVVPMIYERTPNRILRDASKITELCQRLGKRVIIGLRSVDFKTTGELGLEGTIGRLNKSLSRFQSFDGIAIHDYNSYRQLLFK